MTPAVRKGGRTPGSILARAVVTLREPQEAGAGRPAGKFGSVTVFSIKGPDAT